MCSRRRFPASRRQLTCYQAISPAMACDADVGAAVTMLELAISARHRVKLIRQTEMAECGLASLAMIANYHGLRTDLGSLRRMFVPSTRGSTLRSLIGVA